MTYRDNPLFGSFHLSTKELHVQTFNSSLILSQSTRSDSAVPTAWNRDNSRAMIRRERYQRLGTVWRRDTRPRWWRLLDGMVRKQTSTPPPCSPIFEPVFRLAAPSGSMCLLAIPDIHILCYDAALACWYLLHSLHPRGKLVLTSGLDRMWPPVLLWSERCWSLIYSGFLVSLWLALAIFSFVYFSEYF